MRNTCHSVRHTAVFSRPTLRLLTRLLNASVASGRARRYASDDRARRYASDDRAGRYASNDRAGRYASNNENSGSDASVMRFYVC